ncbi:C-type mannose receptor 2-like isoform X2 [Ictalurus furcatus]|uniref:C-type mannose receptor 2-like isoform X2 n=1 Tax=Ictalurus furcatus TaxID=66913 RepID=UPI00234FED3C|nr:C-type mannose receptor 2-like isoform X2 [Ictalurus furcatus]
MPVHRPYGDNVYTLNPLYRPYGDLASTTKQVYRPYGNRSKTGKPVFRPYGIRFTEHHLQQRSETYRATEEATAFKSSLHSCPSIMKLNLFLLFLTGLVPVTVSVLRTVPHNYDLMMTRVTWRDAQSYCRVMYTDLATILSDTDWLRFEKEAASKGLTTSAWVGLYNDLNSWRWSLNDLPLKDVTYTNWSPGEPNNSGGKETCGSVILFGEWWDIPCTVLRPFICYNASFSGAARFIGITSPLLTWPQAQTYCRTHHTDLASSLNSSDNYMLRQVRDKQGNSWIGLYRDTWKWSDGTNASNIPWAPGQPDNYGGYENCAVVNNGLFYDVQCTNLYYFFCHTIYSARSQIMRLQVKSDGSVFDPAVQSSILDQVSHMMSLKFGETHISISYSQISFILKNFAPFIISCLLGDTYSFSFWLE